MKHLKMLGFAIVAVLAFAAIAGAGTASAVTLCKKNVKTVSECPEAERYPIGTVIEGKNVGNVVLTTSGGLINPTLSCTTSTFKGKTTKVTASPTSLTGTIESVTFGTCTDNITGGTCEAKIVNLPLEAHLYTTETTAAHANGNGELIVTNPEGTFNCPKLKEATGAGHCIYKTAEAKLHIDGGNPALATANKIGLGALPTDFGCPPNAQWTATYEVTNPKPLFVI